MKIFFLLTVLIFHLQAQPIDLGDVAFPLKKGNKDRLITITLKKNYCELNQMKACFCYKTLCML